MIETGSGAAARRLDLVDCFGRTWAFETVVDAASDHSADRIARSADSVLDPAAQRSCFEAVADSGQTCDFELVVHVDLAQTPDFAADAADSDQSQGSVAAVATAAADLAQS